MITGGNQASRYQTKDDVIGMKLKPMISPQRLGLLLTAALGILTGSCAGPSPTRSLQSSIAPVPANSIRLASWYEHPGEECRIGYLYQANFDPEAPLQGPARPYHPQAGDIFLSTDQLCIARIG